MICGIDEAGRGPVLGPLVVAGVCLESDAPLRQLNVRDSKKLTAERREQLAPEIEKLSRHEVIIVPAEDIDALRSQMTLNALEARLFASIIRKLRPADIVYVDSADTDELEFKKAIKRDLDFEVEIVSKHQADDLFPVVSAASILAKVRRDAEMRLLQKEFGVEVGSGYPADPITVAFMEQWIREKGVLPPHTRTTWDTARRLMSLSQTRKLDEFQGAPK
ncbi:MAG TPA: ribonuclease HII [Thermoplasmata archaeon]|nr:ribonuclease HII [Thermoplasmata archaeon]